MYLKKLFSPISHSESYKPVDESSVSLTEKEKTNVLKKALYEKIGKINSENYLRSLSRELEFQIPSANILYENLKNELQHVYNFQIDEFNEEPIEKLCEYFSNTPFGKYNFQENDLKKGLLIFGPIGCGKTALMKILSRNTFNPFRVISARKIADEFAEFGHSIITVYSVLQPVNKREWFGHNSIGLCIDDVGTESNKKNYGNEVNVISELILNRYDYPEAQGKTHITTNLTVDEMISIYGNRATSRMREMFNVIEFPSNSPDRRK